MISHVMSQSKVHIFHVTCKFNISTCFTNLGNLFTNETALRKVSTCPAQSLHNISIGLHVHVSTPVPVLPFQ